ncbi:MAG: hypothetical protein KatS3mg031_2767 [Chitinophagales bacterium]|nr:MAG: hypothetical protein KatS3mg031_2767 [Chitinophagales bacterium]
MSRPKKRTYNLKDKLQKLGLAGLRQPATPQPDTECLPSLADRINRMLHILKSKPLKATDMLYLIMYDIENDKVRNRIAKYLEKNGCVRIQKSVFLARTDHKRFTEIHDTLREVQSYYHNHDSILLVPANTTDIRAMKIIGKEIYLETILDKPNTLFF